MARHAVLGFALTLICVRSQGEYLVERTVQIVEDDFVDFWKEKEAGCRCLNPTGLPTLLSSAQPEPKPAPNTCKIRKCSAFQAMCQHLRHRLLAFCSPPTSWILLNTESTLALLCLALIFLVGNNPYFPINEGLIH